jgi:hypothetical protein
MKLYTSTAPSSRELREVLLAHDGRAKVRKLLMCRRGDSTAERTVKIIVGRTRYTITAGLTTGSLPGKIEIGE